MKPDPRQLILDLEQARGELNTASDKYQKAALQILEATEDPEPKQAQDDLRKHIRRLVGNMVLRDKIEWQEAWTQVYKRMRDQGIYDPVAANNTPGKTHLECCAEKNLLPEVLQCIQDLLKQRTHANT